MTTETQRVNAEAVYDALCKQDYDVIESYLTDDVQWTIGGPVEALPFCGIYRGKAVVRHLLEYKIAETLGTRRIIADTFLVDGDRGALLGQLKGSLPNGSAISYRIAQFFTLRNGKVVDHLSLLDSFDAVEQITGQRIDLSPDIARVELDDEMFAV